MKQPFIISLCWNQLYRNNQMNNAESMDVFPLYRH